MSALNVTSSGPFHGVLSSSPSSVWTKNAYSASVSTPATSPAAWWGAMKYDADYQFRGTSLVFVPGTTAGSPNSDGANMMAPSQYGHAILSSVDWEVFVTPPSSDIDDLTRTAPQDLQNRALWETPAGFFLSGVWSIELGQTRFGHSPLAVGLQSGAPLHPGAQYLRSRYMFPSPLSAPPGTRMQLDVHFDKAWRPSVPVTIRCTINFHLHFGM